MTEWLYADAAEPLPEAPGGVYHVVSAAEGSPARYRRCNTIEEAADELRRLRSDPSGRLQSFTFIGRKLTVTALPYPYLVDGDVSIPLFDVPGPVLPEDDDGDLVEVIPRKSSRSRYEELSAEAAAEAARLTRAPVAPPPTSGLPLTD